MLRWLRRRHISLTIAPSPFRDESFDSLFFVSMVGEGFLIFVDFHKTRDTDILAMAGFFFLNAFSANCVFDFAETLSFFLELSSFFLSYFEMQAISP